MVQDQCLEGACSLFAMALLSFHRSHWLINERRVLLSQDFLLPRTTSLKSSHWQFPGKNMDFDSFWQGLTVGTAGPVELKWEAGVLQTLSGVLASSLWRWASPPVGLWVCWRVDVVTIASGEWGFSLTFKPSVLRWHIGCYFQSWSLKSVPKST